MECTWRRSGVELEWRRFSLCSIGYHQFNCITAFDAKSEAAALSDEQHELIKTCLSHFDLLDIVRLCSSSKAVAQLCHSQLAAGSKQLARQLLLQAVQDAAGLWVREGMHWIQPPWRRKRGVAEMEDLYLLEVSDEQRKTRSLIKMDQQSRAVLLLLQAAGGAALLDQSSPDSAATVNTLINTPGVPMAMAAPLVSAGLRMTYQQLMAAVRSKVRGVEVWVQAHIHLGAAIDMPAPAHAAAICLGKYTSQVPAGVQSAPRPSAAALADLLLLAMHVSDASPYESRDIMVVCIDLIREPAAQQLEADTLVHMLHALLEKYGQSGAADLPDSDRKEWGGCLPGDMIFAGIGHTLCSLPGAKHITAEAFTSIVKAAIPYKYVDMFTPGENKGLELSDKIPAAMQLDAATVGSLLEAAVAAGNTYIVATLCAIPAAAGIEQEVAGLMQAAVKVWGAGSWDQSQQGPTIEDLRKLAQEVQETQAAWTDEEEDCDCDSDHVDNAVGSPDEFI